MSSGVEQSATSRRGPAGSEHYMGGPRIHEFLQEMHRKVFAGREADLLTVGEMPGVTIDKAKLFTDPARNELDMVFQFEHMDLDHASSRFDLKPLDLRDLKATLGRWRAGLAEVGWNSLSWNNHDQPARSPVSATTARTGSSRRRCWGRSFTCTAGRPTSTRGRNSA